jgi:hypothetical protein
MPVTRRSPGGAVQGGAQGAPQAQTQTARSVRPVARQQSLITRIYINLRWFHHFVPLLGLVIMLYGIYLAITEPEDIIVGQTVLVGGALIAYIAIYYNKTR